MILNSWICIFLNNNNLNSFVVWKDQTSAASISNEKGSLVLKQMYTLLGIDGMVETTLLLTSL